jgi:hypothetical protein
MCCPLDNVKGNLSITNVVIEKEGQKKTYVVHGIYDRTPPTLADRVFRFFQRLELIEKIAEIADESFHLFGTLLQRYTGVLVYQTLRNLHHAAHDVEHVLHTFCFLGDVARLMTGKFFEYHDKELKQFDYTRSAARVCHAISHFLATAAFLSELKLYQLSCLDKAFKYTTASSALGYAIWTISLIWRRHQGKTDEQFSSDLGIHLAGCLFTAIPLTKTLAVLAPYAYIINRLTAIAGMIHAWCVVQRLMPKDREKLVGYFTFSAHDHHHHSHSHVTH